MLFHMQSLVETYLAKSRGRPAQAKLGVHTEMAGGGGEMAMPRGGDGQHEPRAAAEEGAGERQAQAPPDAPREQPEAEASDRGGQREGAHEGCGKGRAQPALDQMRGLVQAHSRLHG